MSTVDLVGGPFAVIESDPGECIVQNGNMTAVWTSSGAFTILLRKLGVVGLEVVEIYDIEPWAVSHLDIRGLIFCYPCGDNGSDASDATDNVVDPDAEGVWFANQLSTDACASQAILNVVLNLKDVQMSAGLLELYHDTEQMSPLVRR
jgi:ubiquitin carboxyl-terminal hydrolase L5